MAHAFDVQAYQDAGFTFEEIVRIQKSFEDLHAWRVHSEKSVWDNMAQKMSPHQGVHV